MQSLPRTLAFTTEEHERRLGNLRQVLRAKGIDVYVGTKPEHLYYFGGFNPSSGAYYQHLFVPVATDDPPVILTHKIEGEIARTTGWVDDVRTYTHGDDPLGMTVRILGELGIRPNATIGMELSSPYLPVSTHLELRHRLGTATVLDVSSDLDRLRYVKSEAEIRYLRRAAAIADAGMAAAIAAVAPGRAENEVNADIQHAMWTAGTENPPFPTLLGSGPRSGLFHAYAGDRVIDQDDTVLVELMGVKAQYTANMLRTLVAGKASSHVRDLHKIVVEAFWAGFELARPGTPVAELDRATRLVRRDYADFIPGRAGFGVGIGYPPGDVGPSILEGSDYVLEPGLVFSLEPSIAQYEGLTIIVGNCILVTDGAPELLNTTDTRLFECG